MPNDRPQTRFRKLRLAFSSGCAIACVLSLLMWARSFIQWDSPYAHVGRWEIQINSLRGYVYVGLCRVAPGFDGNWLWRTYGRSHFTEHGAQAKNVNWHFGSQAGALGFGTMMTDGYRFIYFPYWFLVLMSAALAASNWMRLRFSLRTLLIAMTLVAVWLGLAVYAARK